MGILPGVVTNSGDRLPQYRHRISSRLATLPPLGRCFAALLFCLAAGVLWFQLQLELSRSWRDVDVAETGELPLEGNTAAPHVNEWPSVAAAAAAAGAAAAAFPSEIVEVKPSLRARPPTEAEWRQRLVAPTFTTEGWTDDAQHITLLVVFRGERFIPMQRYFFDSIRRQKHVNLVLIQHGEHCLDIEELTGGADNIRTVCYSSKDFWKEHAKYFCTVWGGCTRTQEQSLHEKLIRLGYRFAPQQHFPVLRGFIFAEHVDPRAVFWGFCDMDTMMGDLDAELPWDILPTFDVMGPLQGEEDAGMRLIYLRGHLTLLKNSQSTEAKFLDWHDFRDYRAFEQFQAPDPSIEEAEYSSFICANSEINLLGVEGLAPTLYSIERTTTSSSEAGILTLPEWTNIQGGYNTEEDVLAAPFMPREVASALSRRIVKPQRPTFTSKGQVHTIEVHQGLHEQVPNGIWVWFDHRWANWYSSNKLPSTRRRAWRRFLVHQDGNDWVERFEPIDDTWTNGIKDTDAFLGARSWIYAHWQEDKRWPHFYGMKGTPADIFIGQLYVGNSGFNKTGELQFFEPYHRQGPLEYELPAGLERDIIQL